MPMLRRRPRHVPSLDLERSDDDALSEALSLWRRRMAFPTERHQPKLQRDLPWIAGTFVAAWNHRRVLEGDHPFAQRVSAGDGVADDG